MSAGEILALRLLCLLLLCEGKFIVVSGLNPEMTTKSMAMQQMLVLTEDQPPGTFIISLLA